MPNVQMKRCWEGGVEAWRNIILSLCENVYFICRAVELVSALYEILECSADPA